MFSIYYCIRKFRHNTVLCGWPAHWKQQAESGYRNFLAIVRAAAAGHHSLLVPKNIQLYPTKDDAIEGGTIDVWWIVHDGGLLTLLPHLLQQHRGKNLASATCLEKTGLETGFQPQNIDRLLNRDFQGQISDRIAEQVSGQELRQVIKQDRPNPVLKSPLRFKNLFFFPV